jgi:hypothetical protein
MSAKITCVNSKTPLGHPECRVLDEVQIVALAIAISVVRCGQ